MAKYFLFCKCVIFLALFEGIVCPYFNFPVPEFFAADIFDSVDVIWEGETGKFNFKKDNTPREVRHVVLFSEINYDTLKREENDLNVISFESTKSKHKNYNVFFQNAFQADYFVQNKELPDEYKIVGGRIYWHWYEIYICFDDLPGPDIGFKLAEDLNNQQRIAEQEYLFLQSDIDNTFRFLKSTKLIIRNKNYKIDYYISFSTIHDRNAFWGLFPQSIHNNDITKDYFFMSPTDSTEE